jgi:WhiB family redox-sensing transcriptional regulator
MLHVTEWIIVDILLNINARDTSKCYRINNIMSGQEALQTESFEVSPVQPAEGVPDMHVAMYYAGNNPAKLITLSALESFSPGDFVDPSALINRVRDMQPAGQGWSNTTTGLMNYCRKSLAPAELVEFRNNGATRLPSEVRLAQKGRRIGRIILGGMAPAELRTLDNEDEDNKRLPLQVALGRTSYDRGTLRGAPTRFDVYEALWRNPDGLSHQELLENITAIPNLVVIVRELVNLGIVHNKPREENNIYALSDRLAEIDTSRSPSYIQAIVDSMKYFHSQGATQVSTKRVFDRAATLCPEHPRSDISSRFSAWRRWANRAELIPVIEPTNEKRWRTQLTIAPEYRSFIGELIHIKQMLVEESDVAEDWRKDALEQAKAITSDPETVARLMLSVQANRTAVSGKDDVAWAEKVAEHIPAEGISFEDLHRDIVGVYGNIQHRSFLARLPQLPGLGILRRPGLGKRGHIQQFVIKKHTFPRSWTDDRSCNELKPDLFFPLATGQDKADPNVIRQAERAKGICRDCPVKLPCLKSAIDAGEREAVRGGVWIGNDELSTEMKDTVERLVDIQKPWKTYLVRLLIPSEGIDAVELHNELVKMLGTELPYEELADEVHSLTAAGTIRGIKTGDDGQQRLFVMKDPRFSKFWSEDAVCKHMDPEDFYPISNPGYVKPAAQAQIEGIKRICESCPVKLPCLKSAIDAGETDAIRGGVWFADREELTPEARRAIQHRVHIYQRR